MFIFNPFDVVAKMVTKEITRSALTHGRDLLDRYEDYQKAKKKQHVIMLGSSGVGKTSYICSTYRELAEKRIDDFSIKALSKEEHEALFNKGERIRQGIYPSSTDVRELYTFILKHADCELLKFDWEDYRGGILESANEEMAEVAEKMKIADGLIIFFNAYELVHSINSKKIRRYCDIISSLVLNAVSARNEKERLPIAIVVTKCDTVNKNELIKSANFEYVAEKVTKRIKDAVKVVLRVFYSQTVGGECLISEPILFIMEGCLRKKICETYKDIDQKYESANYYREIDTPINMLGEILTGRSSNKDLEMRRIYEVKELSNYRKNLEKAHLKILRALENNKKNK